MKSIFCLLIFILPIIVSAQWEQTVLELNKIPLRAAKVYVYNYCLTRGCGSDAVHIVSKIDSAFANVNGVVWYADKIVSSDYTIIIKNSDDLFFTFSFFKSVSVKKGDLVNKGDFIGLLMPDDDDKYSLEFMMYKKDKSLPERVLISYLKENDIIPCYIKEQIVVAK